MIIISKIIIFVFGMFLISSGLLMLFIPEKAREVIGKAGSTNFINYAEITLRMIPAAGLVIYSDHSLYPYFFKMAGWFMIFTSVILYFIPRRMHHNYSKKCAEFLKPVYLKLLSPLAILSGLFVMYCITL